jgi:hypothetical protein
LNLIKQVGKNRYYEVSEETVLRWLGRWEKYQTMTLGFFAQNRKISGDPIQTLIIRAFEGQNRFWKYVLLNQ